MIDTRKYILVFLITLAVFAIVFLFSEFLFNVRAAQIKSLEANINLNILETEIQYALLADNACDEEWAGSPILIEELNTLAKRLEFMEEQRGSDDPEVLGLKKYYSLLQIKDYLLLRERTRQCSERPLTILYFYSNEGDCTDCVKMGHVLTLMREEYEQLHIYAFDYNLPLSAIQTLKKIYGLEGEPPVLVINRKPYYGFKEESEIEELIPALKDSPRRSERSDSASSTDEE